MIAASDASPDRTEPEPTARASASSSTAKWALWLILGYVAVHHALFCWFDQRLMLDHDEFHVGPFLQLHEIAETGPRGWVDVIASMWRRPPSPYPPLMQVLLALGTSVFGLTPTVYRIMALPWLLLLVWSTHRLVSSRADPWAGVAAAVVVASLPYTGILTRKYFLHIYASTAVLAANAIFWSGWEKTRGYARGISLGHVFGTSAGLAVALILHPIGIGLAAPLVPLVLWKAAVHPDRSRRVGYCAGILVILGVGAWSWAVPALFGYLKGHVAGYVHWNPPESVRAVLLNKPLVAARIEPLLPWIWLIVPGFASLMLNTWTGAASFGVRRVYWVASIAVFTAFGFFFVSGGMTDSDFVIVVFMALALSMEEIAIAAGFAFRDRFGWERAGVAIMSMFFIWVGFDEMQKDFRDEPHAEWNRPGWSRTERQNLRTVWAVSDPGYLLAKTASKAGGDTCRVRLRVRSCSTVGGEMSCRNEGMTPDSARRVMSWAGCSVDPKSRVEWMWTTWRYLGSPDGFADAYRDAVRRLAAGPRQAGDGAAWGSGMTMEPREQGLIVLRVNENDTPPASL